jgi:ATP-dependent DNA helicase PIF1
MQLKQFAYAGNAASVKVARSSRPSLPMPPLRRGQGGAHWSALRECDLRAVCAHLNDWQMARLSAVDRRTLGVARACMRRHLGLGDSQWDVFEAVLHRNENVLIMGAPGSGKSFLLNILKERLRKPLVTASTGAAADKIGAFTLHSALGLGIGTMTSKQVVAKLLKSNRGDSGMCRTLIIDEVSMLTAKLLDLAAECLVMLRGKLPQLVVSGDPMQLGAVAAHSEGPFYEAGLIRRLKPYVLTESFRQAEDSPFLRILNRARLGRARESDVDWLRAHFCPKICEGAPRLFCRLAQVEEYNRASLARLPGEERAYSTILTGRDKKMATDPADPAINLKVGARVLLTRNLPEHPALHNGSCGSVQSVAAQSVLVHFDAGMVVRIKPVTQEFERDGKVVGTRTQLPLVLSFAVSVHRAQGATLDCVAVDLSRCFAPGQAYVALSRVREAGHAEVANLNLWHLNNHDRQALSYYNRCADRSEARAERHKARGALADPRAARGAEVQPPPHEVDDEALDALMSVFEKGLA